MPLINASTGTGKTTFFTVPQLIEMEQMGLTNTIKFGALQTPGAVNESVLTNHNSGVRAIGAVPRITRATGLMTCSSIIYVSGASYYLHHANAGTVTIADINAAINALGNPAPANVSVVFAHNNPQDHHYSADVVLLTGMGIPAAQIFEVENLEFPMFGINNQGQLGY